MIEVYTNGHARNNPHVKRFALYLDAFKYVVDILKTGCGVKVQSVKETMFGREVKDYLRDGALGTVVEVAREYIAKEAREEENIELRRWWLSAQ